MWADAERDSCPAEYRRRRLLNTAKFGWRKVWLALATQVPCSNAAKTRNPLKFAGVRQTNEPIPAASGPKFAIL